MLYNYTNKTCAFPGWEGDFCESDEDGCATFDCFMDVACVDVPAPGVGAICGGCPSGYIGDGAKCAGRCAAVCYTRLVRCMCMGLST